MTGRVFDDAVVEAAYDAWAEFPGGDPRAVIRMILSAAADALEGAIRAEALAPVAALANEWQHVSPGRDAICAALRAVIADPDAVAKHNADVWDEGARAVMNAGSVLAEMPWNPYRTTEGTAEHE